MFSTQIQKLLWVNDVFPGNFDTAVTLHYQNQKWNGFGFATSADLSLVKAITELIERTVMVDYKLRTSNGLAGHDNLEGATRSAVSELIERDLFLCHFYSGIPFGKNQKTALVDCKLDAAVEWMNEHGISSSVHRLGQTGACIALRGITAVKKFGVIVASSYKPTFEDSVQTCAAEALRIAHSLTCMAEKIETIKLSDFLLITKHDFSMHQKLALDLEYAARIKFLFEGEGEINYSPPPISKIEVTELKPSADFFPGCPLVFAKATSKNIQQLFTGPPQPGDINLARIFDFAESLGHVATLTSLPHPFP